MIIKSLVWPVRDGCVHMRKRVALRDYTYSATEAAQAASLANIDDFLGYVMNADEVVKILKNA